MLDVSLEVGVWVGPGDRGGDDADQSGVRRPPSARPKFTAFPSPAPLPPSQCREAAFAAPGGKWWTARDCLCFCTLSVCLGGSQRTWRIWLKNVRNHVPGLGKADPGVQWSEC